MRPAMLSPNHCVLYLCDYQELQLLPELSTLMHSEPNKAIFLQAIYFSLPFYQTLKKIRPLDFHEKVKVECVPAWYQKLSLTSFLKIPPFLSFCSFRKIKTGQYFLNRDLPPILVDILYIFIFILIFYSSQLLFASTSAIKSSFFEPSKLNFRSQWVTV